MSGLRVVVVDDHGLTLSAVSDSLRVNGLVVEARAATARDAVDAVVRHQPDALVIDLDLGPGPTGMHIAVSLRKRFPQLGVVILSGYADPRLLSATLPPAPRGSVYLVKQQVADVASVVTAVRDAVERAWAGTAASVPAVELSRSQVDVLGLIAQGYSNGAIADRLHITEDSVAKSVNRIAKRLDITKSPDTNIRGALTSRYFALVGNRRPS
ncbi:response regulator [Microcella sp.]|uniref:response regulator transcription factor n=1 Tax=Microcella sp. TaxID=1913979 RepID=UPI0025680629|nr:response regulator transcription factor [Microcella sp.]MBX9472882.1 response regulator transcription factor [Microcella sp.]